MKKISFIVIFLLIYIVCFHLIENDKYVKISSFFETNTGKKIIKLIFPHKLSLNYEKDILNLEKKFNQNNVEINNSLKEKRRAQILSSFNDTVSRNNSNFYRFDLENKNKLLDLEFTKFQEQKLDFNDLILEIFLPSKNIIYSGISEIFPGSAYLDILNDQIVLVSSVGIVGIANLEDDKLIFKQIKNNINNFINEDQFSKKTLWNWFSIKDLEIHNNKVYVSYTKELEENCWNTSLLKANFNTSMLIFEEIFSPEECVHSLLNDDKDFNAHQSGGRINFINDKKLIFSTGEYRSRHLSQNMTSTFGKILSINLDNKNYKLLSYGHRNPQGLVYNKDKEYIISTEHGPMGGDEINLINLNNSELKNYGWPIASYGEHYGGNSEKNKKIYQKYPLLKSHSKNNFVEPLKYYVPSIGISQIQHLEKNYYVHASMRDASLYFFKINEDEIIVDLERVFIGERIRDIVFKDNKLYLFLEETASIGIINLKKLLND